MSATGWAVAATAWVQIEAQPDALLAQERAAAWAAVFPDVQGYALGNGWYAIALGPYDGVQAETRLRQLRDENLIPRDSFVSDGETYRTAFWPAAGLPEAEDLGLTRIRPVPAADGPATVTRVRFDDWMWAQGEDRLFNRAYMKKYGLDVGDVSISFEKRY